MSFWTADDKIPVQQTKVSIPAEHGLDYSAGQKININIPPTIKYFQPKESYLHFDVLLKQGLDNPAKLTLDGETGAQCLIRDIRIHSGGSGAVLLEEIQNYNTLVALRYDFETNDAIKDKKAMTEGSLTYAPENRGTKSQTCTIYNNTKHQPWTTPYDLTNAGHVLGNAPWSRTYTGDGDKDWGEDDNIYQGSGYNLVKCLLPLHTGIFQSPKVFPALLTEGLRIEILLEDASKVYRLPDTLHPNRRRTLGLQWHSTTGKDNVLGIHPGGSWISGNKTDKIFVQRTNNQIDLSNCPLVIGQKIQIYQERAWEDQGAGGVKRMKTDKEMIIAELTYHAGAGNDTGVGGNYGLLEIGFTEEVQNDTGATIDVAWYVADDSVLDTTPATSIPNTTDVTLDYEVKNTELILQTLTMPAGYTQKLLSMMASGGAMNYDFLSFTNYKYSQLAGDRVMNMRLPLNQTKAKAILCVPTDASIYTTRQLIAGEDATGGEDYPTIAGGSYPAGDMPATYNYVESIDYYDQGNVSNRTGLVGVCDEASDYQFFYNGQLNPSRKVDLTKIGRRFGVSQQYFIELEKALAMSGIQPLSFLNYKGNFCIGRALALQQGVYNTAGRDFNVQVNYGTPRTPMKPKLWCNYVSHIRRLVVQGDSVVIQI